MSGDSAAVSVDPAAQEKNILERALRVKLGSEEHRKLCDELGKLYRGGSLRGGYFDAKSFIDLPSPEQAIRLYRGDKLGERFLVAPKLTPPQRLLRFLENNVFSEGTEHHPVYAKIKKLYEPKHGEVLTGTLAPMGTLTALSKADVAAGLAKQLSGEIPQAAGLLKGLRVDWSSSAFKRGLEEAASAFRGLAEQVKTLARARQGAGVDGNIVDGTWDAADHITRQIVDKLQRALNSGLYSQPERLKFLQEAVSASEKATTGLL